jgi:WD40 repeat protein
MPGPAMNRIVHFLRRTVTTAGGADGSVRLWDAGKGGLPLMRLSGHTQEVTAVKYSSNGSLLLTVSIIGGNANGT